MYSFTALLLACSMFGVGLAKATQEVLELDLRTDWNASGNSEFWHRYSGDLEASLVDAGAGPTPTRVYAIQCANTQTRCDAVIPYTISTADNVFQKIVGTLPPVTQMSAKGEGLDKATTTTYHYKFTEEVSTKSGPSGVSTNWHGQFSIVTFLDSNAVNTGLGDIQDDGYGTVGPNVQTVTSLPIVTAFATTYPQAVTKTTTKASLSTSSSTEAANRVITAAPILIAGAGLVAGLM